jgi:hypothetical protein
MMIGLPVFYAALPDSKTPCSLAGSRGAVDKRKRENDALRRESGEKNENFRESMIFHRNILFLFSVLLGCDFLGTFRSPHAQLMP